KRPENAPAMLPDDWGKGRPNVWLGTSVEDQATLPRLPLLRAVPAAVRFLSAEPLLEYLGPDLDLTGVGWVIVGGESGPGWARMGEVGAGGVPPGGRAVLLQAERRPAAGEGRRTRRQGLPRDAEAGGTARARGRGHPDVAPGRAADGPAWPLNDLTPGRTRPA